MQLNPSTVARELRLAKSLFGALSRPAVETLKAFIAEHHFSVGRGDLIYFGTCWYVTHSGLLLLAQRLHCAGIQTQPDPLSDATRSRWVFKATVYKSRNCKGFVGYGDADPSNVSPLVHGAELRVAETRAVNRALRKAYGIAICSVEELGRRSEPLEAGRELKKHPPQPTNGNGFGGAKVRDRLCQIIRRHQLDPTLVKSYATDFCAVKALRDASREKIENFVTHLADRAEKDRNALLCHLNSYLGEKEGVA
jgi:hypothetical protein